MPRRVELASVERETYALLDDGAQRGGKSTAESPARKGGPATRQRAGAKLGALKHTLSTSVPPRSDEHWMAPAKFSEHKDKVYSVAFDCNGNFFTADTNGKRALMWDCHTHEKIREFTQPKHGRMFGLAVSPDGKTLVTADYEGSCAHAFDVQDGTHLREFPKADKGLLGHTGGTWALAFSPDGKNLVSGGWDNKGVIWDAEEGKALYELRGHTGRVTGVAYSPHEDIAMQVVATAGFDGTVRTWEPETGDPLFLYGVPTAIAPHPGLNGIAFAPDGSSMSVAGDSGLITIFSVSLTDRRCQGRLVCELKPARTKKRDPITGAKADRSKVLAVAYSPDSRIVATAHADGLVRLWDLALGVEVHIMTGHGQQVKIASHYRNLWRMAGEAHGIKRRLRKVAEIAVNIEQADDVWAVAFAPPRHDKDGGSIDEHERILTGGSDKTARMWQTRNYGVCYSAFGLPGPEANKDDGHTGSVCGVACSPDGSCFVSTGFDRKVKLWDTANGQVKTLAVSAINVSAAFAPDGKSFITGGYDKCATIWSIDGDSISKQKQLSPVDEGNDLRVFCVDYHPSGRFVVTAHGDKKVRVWNVDSANEETECVKVLEDGHEGIVKCVSYSPDGFSLVTGCWGRKHSKGRIWDLESEKCRVELVGHTWNLNGASWCSDGRLVITGSDDKTAIVWNARTGKLVNKLVGHSAAVYAVKLAVAAKPKSTCHAITGGFDGDVRCWDIPSGICERVVSLSGSATAFSFVGQYGELHHQLLSSSGTAIVGLDLSAPVSPTVWANDLLRLTILPDLEERKCERTKCLCERLSGADKSAERTTAAKGQTVDRSSCLLQRIGEHGETALHLALERSNFGLADVLANNVAGGTAALVASMDDRHRTPWSIALSNLQYDPKDIDTMPAKRLQEELEKRYVDVKLIEAADDEKKRVKLMRTQLKLVGSTDVYRQLCGKSGGTGGTSLEELDIEGRDTSLPILSFEDCLRELSCGVLLGWAMATAPEGENTASSSYEPPLKSLLKHAQLQRSSRHQYAVFDTPLPRALIRHFWRAHAQQSVQKEAALYALLVLSFTGAAIVTQNACNRVSQANTTSLDEAETSELMTSYAMNLISSGMTVLLLIRLVYREMLQCWRQGHAEYFGDFWNFFQLLSYPLAAASTVIHFTSIVAVWNGNHDPNGEVSCNDRGRHLRELHALAGGCVWFGLLFYMRGFDRTQTAVPIIKQICVDVYPYLFVLSTILVGCAFIFMHLLDIDSLDVDISRRYVSPARAFLSSFSMMLGSFHVDDFTPDPRGESIIMFIIFMVFVQLVLLNMLIAIMGSSVATVEELKHAAGLHSKCELILDSWAFMKDTQRKDVKMFPRSFPLHIIKDVTKARTKKKKTKDQSVKKINALEEKVQEAIDAQKETELKLGRILGILERQERSAAQDLVGQRDL